MSAEAPAAPAVPTLGNFSSLPLTTLAGGVSKPTPVPTFWNTNPVFSYVNEALDSVAARRAALGLSNPGTMENLDKEVSRDVFLTNYFFTGLRADLTKAFSLNPAFQVSHAFSIGSENMPPYAFAAFYANDQLFAQGTVDNDLSLSGRLHYGWSKNSTSKMNVQISKAQPAMVQLEHDILGPDFSINLKALNPSFLEGSFTGVAVGSYLQSLTSSLSLGLETMYSSQSPMYPADVAVSYVGRYDAKSWIASAQVQAQGVIMASFWRKVTDKVEAGIQTQISAMGRPGSAQAQAMMMGGAQPTPEGIATIGAKYEFRQSVFRGQIDTDGKVSCLLEKRVLPPVSVIFAGEIDHSKNSARIGLGLQFESGGEELMQQQQQQQYEATGQQFPPL
ncbi:hypothetical protein NADFUDRAFT_46159 [Nadsonia fulvescens var. elongata DSM 6958]|uniref:Translocase of outer membrane 40 kDa subunit n=1 Tax=Nadsonia fulvescens var. elongata DSM 6958 TaxID=857566 RepID=A0A1E3PNI4_9ASCO|nr:hypothetical protein NADFUDRAFT_46159 [Nadsonia fulvescens var. elongata DSM 6958]